MACIELTLFREPARVRWHLRTVHTVWERRSKGSIYGWERRGEVHASLSAGEAEIIAAALEDVLGQLRQAQARDVDG